jgi:hypothetical protein
MLTSTKHAGHHALNGGRLQGQPFDRATPAQTWCRPFCLECFELYGGGNVESFRSCRTKQVPGSKDVLLTSWLQWHGASEVLRVQACAVSWEILPAGALASTQGGLQQTRYTVTLHSEERTLPLNYFKFYKSGLGEAYNNAARGN